MKKLPVISGAFDRVTDCVAEIQKCALACLVTLVSADTSRFNLNVALDEPLQRGRVADLPRLQYPKHLCVGDDGVLDNLREPLIELTTRHCFQNVEIINHERGLM